MKAHMQEAIKQIVAKLRDRDGNLKFDASLILCSFAVEWSKYGQEAKKDVIAEIRWALREAGITEKLL